MKSAKWISWFCGDAHYNNPIQSSINHRRKEKDERTHPRLVSAEESLYLDTPERVPLIVSVVDFLEVDDRCSISINEDLHETVVLAGVIEADDLQHGSIELVFSSSHNLFRKRVRAHLTQNVPSSRLECPFTRTDRRAVGFPIGRRTRTLLVQILPAESHGVEFGW